MYKLDTLILLDKKLDRPKSRCTAANMGFCASMAGRCKLRHLFVISFSSGLTNIAELLVVILYICFSISSGCGRTFFKSHACTKPCSLYKRLAALAFCTTCGGCTAVVRRTRSAHPSYNCGFAKLGKKILASLNSFS